MSAPRIIVTVHNSKRVAEAPRAPSGTRKRIGTSYAARGRGERASSAGHCADILLRSGALELTRPVELEEGSQGGQELPFLRFCDKKSRTESKKRMHDAHAQSPLLTHVTEQADDVLFRNTFGTQPDRPTYSISS